MKDTKAKDTKSKTIKMKGRNGIIWMKRFKVTVGKTKTAVYFFSAREGMQAPSAIIGDSTEVIKMMDEIKVEMVKQSMLKDKQTFISLYLGFFELLVGGHQFYLERSWTATNQRYQ